MTGYNLTKLSVDITLPTTSQLIILQDWKVTYFFHERGAKSLYVQVAPVLETKECLYNTKLNDITTVINGGKQFIATAFSFKAIGRVTVTTLYYFTGLLPVSLNKYTVDCPA